MQAKATRVKVTTQTSIRIVRSFLVLVGIIPVISSCSGINSNQEKLNSHFSSEAWQQQFQWFQDQQDTDFLIYVRRFDKAETLANDAIKKAKNFGQSDPRLARSLTSLARIQIEKGQYKESIASLNKAFKIKSAKFGMKSSDVADILSEIAYAELKMGQQEKAKQSIAKAIQIRRELNDVFGEMDSNYIEGLLLAKENEAKLAAKKFETSIRIYSNDIKNPLETLSTEHLNRMKDCFSRYLELKSQADPKANLESVQSSLSSLTAWLNILGQSGI